MRKEAGKNKYGLSDAHEAFCRLRAQGVERKEAYKRTVADNPNMTDACAMSASGRLERLDKIQARLNMLREQAEAQAMMSTADIQAKLTEIATDEDQPVAAQLKAMDQLAKIQGAYNEKVEVRATVTMDEKEEAMRRLMEASFAALRGDGTGADARGAHDRWCGR